MRQIISLFTMFFFCLAVQAKVWTVTDHANVGSRAVEPVVGSLQYYVNNADDGDTIAFDASFAGASILFDTTLVVNTGMVIDASSLSAPVRFDGQNQTTLLTLGNASSKNESLQENTFCNIVFENGVSEVAGQGGAVNIFAYRITFNRCQFLNNSNMIDNSNRQPGAIRNETSSSQMWLNDCVFRGNKTKRKGGAIAVDAPSLYINRCIFEDNHAGECGAVLAVKSTKDNVVLRDNNPIIDIRNSTFVGNKCDQNQTSAGGLIIIHEDGKSIMPMRLFFNTFVGNVNEVNTSTVYSVYSTTNNITMAGNVFGGNTHITEDAGVYALCGDVNVGGGKAVISEGYNFIYRLKHNLESDPVNAKDKTYRQWMDKPVLESVINADGVCVPTKIAMDSALWQPLKMMPKDFAEELLGYNPIDQTGAPRTSKLVFSGAYEFPAYVLDIEDDYYSVVTPGIGTYVYAKDEIATLSSNSDGFVSWIVNDVHHVNNPYCFRVTEDCTIRANYDDIPGGAPAPDEDLCDEGPDDIEQIAANDGLRFIAYSDGVVSLIDCPQGELAIYSASGQQLLSVEVNGSERIQLRKTGICLAVLRTANGTQTMKF